MTSSPDPAQGDAHVTLPVAAVARRLGVAPTTLRTWHRRYGLGPSVRADGSHRRYTAADLARLDAMRRLVMAGVTPAEAARLALAADDPETLGVAADAGDRFRTGGTGGRVLSLANAPPRTRGLARAAMSLDAAAVAAILTEAIDAAGVIAAWDDLIRPLLVAIGDRWSHTGEGVEVEHLLCEAALTALHRAAAHSTPATTRPVLLACSPDEYHSLPLVALGAALAQHGVAARVLGAATPADALVSAVRRIGPAAVLLWSQAPDTGAPAVFDAVPRLRPPTVLLAGGPGWPPALPSGVVYLTSIRHAVDVISAASRGAAVDVTPS